MKIIGADERLQEKTGAKILIAGPPKVGKTTLLKSLNPGRTLFVDLEAGHQAVMGWPVATAQPATWNDCRNLAVYMTGPNLALPADAAYSQAHYDAVHSEFELDLARIDTYFIDSITVAARLCFTHVSQLPEAFSERTGKQDIRACYGLLAREMISWLTTIQHARGKNVVFVCLLEPSTDELRRGNWDLQIEGKKTGHAILGLVDQILTMHFVSLGDDQAPTRCFVCQSPNPWTFPAGDRSGKLDLIERPHLGDLLTKLAAPGNVKPLSYDIPKPVTDGPVKAVQMAKD